MSNSPRVPKVLLLAGTTEATKLADRLVSEHGADVLSSFAGLTELPGKRAGRVRRGGFGGTEGLITYLRSHPVDVLVDATHPFADVMPFHAHAAAIATSTLNVRLLRPAWRACPEDRWTDVADMDEAVSAVSEASQERVFLTVGRREVSAFSDSDAWFLVRSIEAPNSLPKRSRLVLDRGPFDLASERALMIEHAVDVIVSKNSGGTATAAKLKAARGLGLPVVLVSRPPQPAVPTIESVDQIVTWLQARGVL